MSTGRAQPGWWSSAPNRLSWFAIFERRASWSTESRRPSWGFPFPFGDDIKW